MKLSAIILNESTKVTDLKGLTWDVVSSIFPKIGTGYYSSINFPNPDDSSRSVQDEQALESWKAGIEKRYGNVNIKLDNEADSPWEKVQVLDDKFRGDKKSYTAGKAAWLDKERAAGRKYGLD